MTKRKLEIACAMTQKEIRRRRERGGSIVDNKNKVVVKSQGLKELFGEYINNPDGGWWYQKPAIVQAMKNIGCPDILINKIFDELDKE